MSLSSNAVEKARQIFSENLRKALAKNGKTQADFQSYTNGRI